MSRASSLAVRALAPGAIALAVLSGCARSVFEEEPRGSIKDTPVAEVRPAPPRSARVPVKRVQQRAEAPAAKAETAAPPSPGAARPGVIAMPPAAPPGRVQPAEPAPAAPGAPDRPRADTAPPRETAPPLGTVSPQAQAEASRRLLEEGNRLFAAGDVVRARERYLAAMNGPIPEVMLAFGRSFDPFYLARLPRSNAAPDAQRAVTIYEGAVRQGSKDAEADLQRLRRSLSLSPSGTPVAPAPKGTPPAAPAAPSAPPAPAAPAAPPAAPAAPPAAPQAAPPAAPPAPPAQPPASPAPKQ